MQNNNCGYFVNKWSEISYTWKGLNQFTTTDKAQAIATANRLWLHHGRKVKYRVMEACGGTQTQVHVTE